MSKQQVVDELHKPARKFFPRRHTVIKGLHDIWQADLAEFIPYGKQNRGYKYILLVIDCFSKYIWTSPLKTKTGKEVTDAFKKILKDSVFSPRLLLSDGGREFYNTSFGKLMKLHNINHYSTYSVTKAAIAERAIRTIKNLLYKKFSLLGSYKWLNVLPEITAQYNNSKHRTTKMKPVNVTSKTRLNVYKRIKSMGSARYKLNDIVRISRFKSIFDKSYIPNWSTELFKIVRVQVTNPVTYKLEDMHGRPILGGFYQFEIQKTKNPNVYLVEKVLRKKGQKLYVKWLGLNERSWINKTDIV
jgi:hypothetical protein